MLIDELGNSVEPSSTKDVSKGRRARLPGTSTWKNTPFNTLVGHKCTGFLCSFLCLLTFWHPKNYIQYIHTYIFSLPGGVLLRKPPPPVAHRNHLAASKVLLLSVICFGRFFLNTPRVRRNRRSRGEAKKSQGRGRRGLEECQFW